MASEIRVNKIENRSGLGTVTFADTGVDLAGIVTATTFSGSGASLTNVPDSALSAVTASKLSGALPAISAASLTNVPAANVVGVHTSLTVTNATTTGTAVVGGGVTISESGIEASGIGITCANINGAKIGGRRNLVINGAMQVAQRGSQISAEGYVVDRMKILFNGADESPTTFHGTLDSNDTGPYQAGFRNSVKVQNGNQSSGAGSSDYMLIRYTFEGQDLAQSGWNYLSSSSFVTISFWAKSSVSYTAYGMMQINDGTSRMFTYSYALTANTWKKVTVKVPGSASPAIQIDNDNGGGAYIDFWVFAGTSYTSSGAASAETWADFANTARFQDMASTWWTTNNATFEMTGLQLEVGPEATPFEFRSLAEELLLCKRYFQFIGAGYIAAARGASSTMYLYSYTCPVDLRASPTVSTSNDIATGTFGVRRYRDDAGVSDSTSTPTTNSTYFATNNNTVHLQQDGFSAVDDRSASIFVSGGAITLSSEF